MKQQTWIYVWLGLAAALTFFVPEISYAKETLSSNENWDEEYTDTDTGRGTLAVRCEVFEGFHGTVEVRIRGITGGRESTARLTEMGGYMTNLTLPEEIYEVTELDAVSNRWVYACKIDQSEIPVMTDAVALLIVQVTANGSLILPDEVQEVESSQKMGSGQGDSKQQETEAVQAEERVGSENERRRIPLFSAAGLFAMAACLTGLFWAVKKNRR